MVKARHDSASGQTGPQGTVLFRPGELDEVIASPSADHSGDVEHAALVGAAPPFLDQRFVLKRGKTLIGRGEDNDIVLPHGSVSAQHAWVVHDNGHYRVMNMLSTNGTFINGAKAHDAPLADGDRIRFGKVELVFHAAAVIEPPRSTVPPWVWAASALVVGLSAAAMLVL